MRMSVTELDSFRYYRESEMSLEDLLAQLRKETPPTLGMQAGSAWHKALELESWPAGEVEMVKQDGFTFRIVAEVELALPQIRELKGEMEMQTSSGPVTLVGVVDWVDAAGIHDYKYACGVPVGENKHGGSFDAERYADSYQWRCYLLMFGGQAFVYDVFVGRYDERADEWLVMDYHRLPLYAYPNLRADVQREVEGFAAFVAAYLPERLQPALAGSK